MFRSVFYTLKVPQKHSVPFREIYPASRDPFLMGQTAGRVDRLKDTVPEVEEAIPELKSITLKGVIPLDAELGRGAYGSVFTVQYNGVVCAAKKIHPILIESVTNEEKQRTEDNFMKECLCCSTIRHPNIVQFVGVYFPSGQSSLPVMVMELMNTSLTEFVESNKSKIAFDRKISILHDISLGLEFLHNRKPLILHRDLSPNNVLLTTELVAKIGDLGVAKVVQADNRQTKSRLTTAPGTLHFMPPEALDEINPIYGTPIDVFSFGGIALYVFSEEWPTPSRQKIMDPITNKLVACTEVERRQPYLDKITDEAVELRKMVKCCLDDDPGERPLIEEVSAVIDTLKVRIIRGIKLSIQAGAYEPPKAAHKLLIQVYSA